MRSNRSDGRAFRLRAAALPLALSIGVALAAASPARAQQAQDDPVVSELIQALRELREEMRALRTEVADLRREIEDLRRSAAGGADALGPGAAAPAPGPAAGDAPGSAAHPVPRTAPMPQAARPYIVDPPVDGAIVRGRVVFKGGPQPERPLIPVTRDVELFGPTLRSEDLIVAANGGIESAVVWIEAVDRGRAFGFPRPVVEARGPRFTPRVQVAAPHAMLRVVNGNPVTHVFRAPRLFNLSIPGQNDTAQALGEPGLVRIVDDLHPWMVAYVFVSPNPYGAVTGTDGAFQLDEVPAGKHRIRVWHETLGEATREVEVGPGGTIEDVEIELKLGR